MTPRLIFRPQAESELLEARGWYEERRPGLGQAFATAINKAIASIVENPLMYPCIHGETRRALVQRFPYGIYFRVLSNELVVLAVMHGRRFPRRWQSRR